MSTPTTNFLGIPIEGEITRQRRAQQRPREEFEPLVRALIDDPYIVEFGWRQYTPYFNDGDTCIFGAHGFWVRTQDQPVDTSREGDDEYEDLEVSYGTHPSLGGLDGWGEDARYVGDREGQWRACRTLAEAVEGDEFDSVLLDLFGDHCEVKVSRGGITVDEYSHD